MLPYSSIPNFQNRDPVTHKLTAELSSPELDYLAGLEWTATEKVDGMNIRVIMVPFGSAEFPHTSVDYYGRTGKTQLPKTLLSHLHFLFDADAAHPHYIALRDLAVELDAPLCIYGEGYGAGIQKGAKYKADGQAFVVIDIRVGNTNRWLSRDQVLELCGGTLPVVPTVVGGDTLWDIRSRIQTHPTSMWGDFPMEGFVCRPVVPLCDRFGDRVQCKMKICDYPQT